MIAMIGLLAAGLAMLHAGSGALRPEDRGTLVFEDNFNRWKPAWTTRQVDFTESSSCARADASCARTANGEMILSVQTDPATPGAYLTGHVGTQHAREFTYGYFETKAKTQTDLGGRGAQAEWHTYGLDWRPDRYDFYVDGQLVATTTEGLSDRPKFLVLSILAKDFEIGLLDQARLREYKARFKYVRVWQ